MWSSQNHVWTGAVAKFNSKYWRRTEYLFLFAGILMLLFFGAVRLHQVISSRMALARFKNSSALAADKIDGQPRLRKESDVDFSLWNPKRIRAYQQSLIDKTDLPAAVLRIPKLNLEVPVYEGTDDLTLNRGVGRIIGTARIGVAGNTGIAGHRDGFFRGLKDIAVGDVLELSSAGRTVQYSVGQIEIVQPDDVSVLADNGSRSLTLVTCYPFYFVGSAPQRFIVHAAVLNIDGIKEPSSTTAGEINLKEKLK